MIFPSMLCAVLAAAFLHLASPHQQWRRAGPLAARRWRLAVTACAAASVVLAAREMGVGPALCLTMASTMFACVAWPLLGLCKGRWTRSGDVG